MFKDAKGNFDGRIFIGLMMGLGSVTGAVLKVWWSVGETLPPFWLWAVPLTCLTLGIVAWLQRRREQKALRERLERSARVDALRSRMPAPAAADDITSID